ncbi:Transferase [Quillaja saponaria]|uniref:Transferase n=1 Tax=Quillaja saponaria TaxID=32244 RepID=A0AAD7Q251_QUISA|nr:Transferase [Quillaja saponaria]
MSKQPNRVTVHSKLTAVSSKPIGPGKAHPLSVLDHAMGHHTLHMIFYYRDKLFGSFDLDPLRESLTEVLSLYPPVTGRLAREEKEGNWKVKCNDAGVRVIRAKVDTTLDEWLRSADGSEERDLTVWDEMPDDPHTWSPFVIQVNEFEGEGIAIGLSCTHMHADLTSATLLFKSWTEVHRHAPISHPPLFNPSALRARPVLNTCTKSATYYANKSTIKAQTPSEKLATATFRFSNSVIKHCLLEVSDICHDATPFDFLSALFWTCIARLKPTKNDHSHSLSICTDFRNMLKAPVSTGYFGNALHFSMLSLAVREMDHSQLGHVAGFVHHHVAGLEEQEIWPVIDWFESQKDKAGKFAPPFCMYGPELTCVSMEHMIIPSGHTLDADQSLMYEAMFSEKEIPVHVSCHVGNMKGEGLIMVMPAPEGGLARSVMVMLPEKELPELCKDETILRLEPTMLLTGRS